MIEETRISFETAKLAFQKGFINGSKMGYTSDGKLDYPHYGSMFKNNDDSDLINFEAPTQSLLQRWLREEHNIQIQPFHSGEKENKYMVDVFKNFEEKVKNEIDIISTKYEDLIMYDSYEEALEVGLIKGLNKIKII